MCLLGIGRHFILSKVFYPYLTSIWTGCGYSKVQIPVANELTRLSNKNVN